MGWDGLFAVEDKLFQDFALLMSAVLVWSFIRIRLGDEGRINYLQRPCKTIHDLIRPDMSVCIDI
jgi:hypothetical protein